RKLNGLLENPKISILDEIPIFINTSIMKRYHYLIICLAIAIASFGCTKPDEDPAELVGVRFQGQYKVIMAVADRQVDVNHDGNASNDILAEIPALANSY